MAHSSTYRQFCQTTGTWHAPPHTGNSAKSLAHCPQTGNSAKSLSQAILPNHWQLLHIHKGNSAKSLAHCPQTDNSAKSLAQGQISQITGTGNAAKSLACSSTDNSAKSLAHCPQTWQNCLCVDSMPVVRQNCLYVEERASDLAELPVPVIWQNHLYVDSVPVIWQNCLCK